MLQQYNETGRLGALLPLPTCAVFVPAGETLPVPSKGGAGAGAAAVPRNHIPGAAAISSCLSAAARLAPHISPTALWSGSMSFVPLRLGQPTPQLAISHTPGYAGLSLPRRGCFTSGRCGSQRGWDTEWTLPSALAGASLAPRSALGLLVNADCRQEHGCVVGKQRWEKKKK